jgi:hypothetical protein
MADSNEEIKAVQKRLKKAENGIKRLEETDLLIARVVADLLCTIEYNMFLSTRKGEEIESYVKIWKEKSGEIHRKVKDVRTVRAVLDLVYKFDGEIVDYIKAEKVKTAEEAMDIAHAFVKKYSSTALPMKATKEDAFWHVDMDVGAVGTKIAKIKIDARTGEISSYEVPEYQAKSGK